MLAPADLRGWTPLGPGNVGGRTRALVIHPRTPDIMFAAGSAGGVWRTVDGGKNWTPLTDLLPNMAVNALVLDPNNPETIYAGTGEGYFNAEATRGAGIFRSFDGGNTWRRLDGTNTPDFWYVNDIVISKSNSNRIYAATRAGVMRSTDGGVNWTRQLNETTNNGCTDLAIRTDSSTDVIFAACGMPEPRNPWKVVASIYRNDNAGALGQWEPVYSEEGMTRTSLAIAPSNQNVIYAVAAAKGTSAQNNVHSLYAVFRSTNGGVAGSWNKVNDDAASKLNSLLFTNPYFAVLNECDSRWKPQLIHQGWHDNTIAVDPLNENIVWVGGVDLFRSDDGGVNWGMASFWQAAKTNSRYVHADQHVIAFHPQFNNVTNRAMFVGTDGGIFRTENARAQTVRGNRAPCLPDESRVTWTALNNGYAVTQFYHGAVFPGGQRYLGGTQDNGVIYGSDELGPNNWLERLSGDGGFVAIDPLNPQIVYAGNPISLLEKSTNGGQTFSPATDGITNTGFEFIAPLTMDPSDPARLWLGGGSLWRTRNNANNWSQAGMPLKGSATAIAVAPSDGNFVLAGTNQGYIHRTALGLSSSADTDWPSVKVRSGTNIIVSAIAFDPTNRDIAYATVSNFGGRHVFRTVNGGQNWQAIDGAPPPSGLPDIPVNCIVIDPTDTQRLYIGTDLGVFTSPDGGASWAVENTGFANVPVEWLTINAYKGAAYLFAFTRGRGAWRVPLGQVCTSVPSPQSQTFEVTGGRGNVQVTVSSASCEWTVENNNPWITVTSSPAMRGNGMVTFQVAPSPDRKPRFASITIAGNSFVVTQAGEANCVSAVSFVPGPYAPESAVAAFGEGMADRTLIPSGGQLPTTLAGVSVVVKDQTGQERPAPLFFVSSFQINFLIPAGTATGPALVTIYNGKDKAFNSRIEIKSVAPALFTADGRGKGVPVGNVLRVKANNQTFLEPLSMMDAGQTLIIPRPIDLGPDLGQDSDRVFLILFGTGIRHRSSLGGVSARIGSVDAPVSYAGAQNDFVGLDQLNIEIPRTLAGRGEVELLLTVDGQKANPVLLHIK
ncbi:MAG TPA: BACON domain-containing carbohydrate-binding protein, partial [Blastocatellia bacterium]|nr:BACON domain-containing carbohydrate-binding protein [Blastocatellia bacterium]